MGPWFSFAIELNGDSVTNADVVSKEDSVYERCITGAFLEFSFLFYQCLCLFSNTTMAYCLTSIYISFCIPMYNFVHMYTSEKCI